MRPWMPVIVGLVAFLFLGASGLAAAVVPLLSDSFEDYVADESLPKAGTEMRGAYGYESEAGGVQVKTDMMSGLLDTGSQAVRIHKDAIKGGTYLDAFPLAGNVLTFDQLADGGMRLVVGFDVFVSAENKNHFYAALRCVSGSENFATLFFKAPSRGTSPVWYSVAGGREMDTGIRVTADHWHRVTCEIRQREDGKWTFSADILDKETGDSTALVKDALPALDSTDVSSLNRLRFYQFGSEAGACSSYIDNISVFYTDEETTPAPAPHTSRPQGDSLPQAVQSEAQGQPPSASAAVHDRVRILGQKTITDEKSGYVAWPTVALLPNDELLVIASGGRIAHACPFGKYYLYRSTDLGKTWEGPTTIQDGKLDDRGCSLMRTSKGTLLAGGFSSIAWTYYIDAGDAKVDTKRVLDYGKQITLEDFKNEAGFWMLRSTDDGLTWNKERAISNSPHGPCELEDGSLLFVGYEASSPENLSSGQPTTGGLIAAKSTDDGKTWNVVSRLPVAAGHRTYQYHEPHAVQASDGTIIVHIRKSYPKTSHTLQVTSADGGLTWTQPTEVYWGYPSHLLRLKNGALLATYGYRRAPLGVRASISSDNGKTWSDGLVIYDKAVSGDMGYPSTVELKDGSFFTVWYELRSPTETVLQSAHWELVKNDQS